VAGDGRAMTGWAGLKRRLAMRCVSLGVFAAISTVMLAGTLRAHEFWVEPSKFRPGVGEKVDVRLLVGDGFPGEVRKRDDKKIERLDVIGPRADAKAERIAGKDGEEIVGSVVIEKAGVHAIVYRGRESIIELEADKFEAYLKEDGLDNAADYRRQHGETGKAGREAYSRCAKGLLCAGADSSGAWSVKTGLGLEIVPVDNPYAAKAGDRLAFVLLEGGKPVEGAMMVALHAGSEGKTLRTTARTDKDGRASFELKQPGVWLINSVRMARAVGRTDVEWTSVWSSLTFDIAPLNGGPDMSTCGTGNSCMSFADLFRAAKKRGWTEEERARFAALDQPARNAMVKQLAAEAGDIKTEDRRGTDGVVYTAFWR
jgi:uncharacterized GH25 family protein